MSISKEEAQSYGANVENLGPTAADPDVDEVVGELTIDGHTLHFNGRSEDAVLESIETALKARGRIERGDEGDVAEAEPQETQSVEETPDLRENVSAEESESDDGQPGVEEDES